MGGGVEAHGPGSAGEGVSDGQGKRSMVGLLEEEEGRGGAEGGNGGGGLTATSRVA